MFYVYEYYNTETLEVFYVGKGTRNRYRTIAGRNELFLQYYQNNKCDVRIVKYFDNEDEAFQYEQKLIEYYKQNNECICNKNYGGLGGVSGVWTPEKRLYQSIHNPMKSEDQRERIRKNNPMKQQEIVEKVATAKHGIMTFYGKNYYTYKALSEAWGISTATISESWKNHFDLIQQIVPNPTNINGPYTLEEKKKIHNKLVSLKLSGEKRVGTSFTIFNIKYQSIQQACDTLGVSRDTIKRWKNDEEELLKRFPELNEYNQIVPKELKNKIITRHNKSSRMKKPIYINGVIYDSAGDASKILGINANTIRSRCKNKSFPTYYFLYDNQQPSHENSNNSIMEGSTTNE